MAVSLPLLTVIFCQVEANLYAFVYATVAMNCTEKEWEAIFQEYTKESLQSKQRYLMKALASTFNVDIVKKLLKYTMGMLNLMILSYFISTCSYFYSNFTIVFT